MESFIIELTRQQCELMGQLIHIHLDDGEDHPIGRSLLFELMAQTSCVFGDKSKHLVGMGIESRRVDVAKSHSAWYVPYDDGKD